MCDVFSNTELDKKENEDILKFIEDVNLFDTSGDIKNLFTKKYCYGFALMLKQFNKRGKIFWDKYNSHAVYKLNNIFYDIRGIYQPMNYELLYEVNVEIIEGNEKYK